MEAEAGGGPEQPHDLLRRHILSLSLSPSLPPLPPSPSPSPSLPLSLSLSSLHPSLSLSLSRSLILSLSNSSAIRSRPSRAIHPSQCHQSVPSASGQRSHGDRDSQKSPQSRYRNHDFGMLSHGRPRPCAGAWRVGDISKTSVSPTRLGRQRPCAGGEKDAETWSRRVGQQTKSEFNHRTLTLNAWDNKRNQSLITAL